MGCHSEGPVQPGEVGSHEPQEVQQDQMQGFSPRLGKPPVSMQAEG